METVFKLMERIAPVANVVALSGAAVVILSFLVIAIYSYVNSF